MNDNQKIGNAFKELRKMGWFARMNFWCCQSCGCSAIPDEAKDKFVFYHKQDAEAIRSNGNIMGMGIHLTHGEGGDANEICAVLRKNGLDVEWNGDMGKRIMVKHLVEEPVEFVEC